MPNQRLKFKFDQEAKKTLLSFFLPLTIMRENGKSNFDIELGNKKFIFSKRDDGTLSVLGEGSYGIVFQIEDITSQEKYALKIVYLANQKIAEDFVKEINSHKILSSSTNDSLSGGCQPGINCLLDYENNFIIGDKNFGFALYQKASGNTLDLLKSSIKFSSDQIKEIATKLVLSLSKIHMRGLVHNDIKLDNILVLPNGEFIFADLGGSCKNPFMKFYSSVPSCESIGVVTIPYLSPKFKTELLSFQKAIEKYKRDQETGLPAFLPKVPVFSFEEFMKNDIWALGLTLFILFNKKPPFDMLNIRVPTQKDILKSNSGNPDVDRMIDNMLSVSNRPDTLKLLDMMGIGNDFEEETESEED